MNAGRGVTAGFAEVNGRLVPVPKPDLTRLGEQGIANQTKHYKCLIEWVNKVAEAPGESWLE